MKDLMAALEQSVADAKKVLNEKDRCAARSTYDGTEQVPIRCALRQAHAGLHNPRLHGYGPFGDDDA